MIFMWDYIIFALDTDALKFENQVCFKSFILLGVFQKRSVGREIFRG